MTRNQTILAILKDALANKLWDGTGQARFCNMYVCIAIKSAAASVLGTGYGAASDSDYAEELLALVRTELKGHFTVEDYFANIGKAGASIQERQLFRVNMLQRFIATYEALEAPKEMKPSELLTKALDHLSSGKDSEYGKLTYLCNAISRAARYAGSRTITADARNELRVIINREVGGAYEGKLIDLLGQSFFDTLTEVQIQGFRRQYAERLIEQFKKEGK